MKYSHFILLFWTLQTGSTLWAQWRVAHTGPEGLIETMVVETPLPEIPRASQRSAPEIRLREGYPLIFAADPLYKNFRNVTLADLDDDGADEIIFGVANRFFVYRKDTLWWSHTLQGLGRFPAAVDDLENDGIKDIVFLTGFNDDEGQVYAFNARGVLKPGWPRSYGGRWMISSPALYDVDEDGRLEIACSDLENGLGSVHLIRSDGTPYSNDWPVTLPNVPAVTPSLADLDQDGKTDLVICSTREIYAFDLEGRVKPGWPFNNQQTKFSFQSPLLADLESDGKWEIITEGHGDLPLYLILNFQGGDRTGWPRAVPERQWTYHTPTIIDYQGAPLILTGRPILNSSAKPMLFAWREDGSLLDGFPIVKSGGLEGLITVADIDDDTEPDIIFPSNLIDSTGHGFIHAYELDGSGEVPGFPIRPYGWTYLNGATIGDVDGNGLLDLAVLTYTENPGSQRDSGMLYVYEINTPADPERIFWSTYKGSNTRNGRVESKEVTSSGTWTIPDIQFFPNPVKTNLYLKIADGIRCEADLYNLQGVGISHYSVLENDQQISMDFLAPGIYFLKIIYDKNRGQEIVRLIKH